MIDLSSVVSKLGETTITEIGEPLGLSKEQSMAAAKALAENFTGNKDQAIAAAAKETGLGKEVIEPHLAVGDCRRRPLDSVPSQRRELPVEEDLDFAVANRDDAVPSGTGAEPGLQPGSAR